MAKTTDWGLTDAGFRRPTYAELLDALEYKARELFGSKANLTVRSPLGIFLRIFAWMLNLLFSTLEDVYNSRFIDTAVGSSLYNLGRAIGLRLLGAQKAVGYLTFTGDNGVEVPEGFLAETIAGVQYITLQSATIKDGSVIVPATAVIPGPDGNTEAGTITMITNPKTGIATVVNIGAFEGGRDTETDAEFRERYYASTDFAGGVNIDAVVAEIYESVEAVIAVTGDENDTDETDENGLPPHSIEVVAYGGLDEEIAEAIFKRKAAGIQTYGNTTIPVVSASGKTFNISFSRPAPVNVWVKVFNLVTDRHFPLDGVEQIKAAIVSYIGSDTRGGLDIGEDVICVKLPTEVLKVSGVVDFDLQISADGETYGWNNVEIAARQKAVTDEGMVSVE
ncbi:MAG: baseplate J/gp47 family protein [Lachnospiraceae bacterium]|nr:baseplate J/gp47 family protein [Clostridia bacterium]MBR1691186.1 baseplate J/gp47 family protein [Lachnospiraceae bacterium]